MSIPATFRPQAKVTAASRLAGATNDDQRQKIINEVSEEEWRLDMVEWRNWMDSMRWKFSVMHATPKKTE